jgi:3-oxoacyl-[acyl-carrier protein] reductase
VQSIDSVSIDVFESTWRTNCGAAYLLTQLCMPAMEGEGWGRVVFISSVAGFTGGVVGPHYASSKSALHGLVHWLAGAYARRGITVNAVAPALIDGTKMLPGRSGELESSKSCLFSLPFSQWGPCGGCGFLFVRVYGATG